MCKQPEPGVCISCSRSVTFPDREMEVEIPSLLQNMVFSSFNILYQVHFTRYGLPETP